MKFLPLGLDIPRECSYCSLYSFEKEKPDDNDNKLFLKHQFLTLGHHRIQFSNGVPAVARQEVFQTSCLGVQFRYLEAIFLEFSFLIVIILCF